MNNQEILDNAPEGATHYKRGHYSKISFDFRYIDDIKRIAELEEENTELRDLASEYLARLLELMSKQAKGGDV